MTEEQYLMTVLQEHALLIAIVAIANCVVELVGKWQVYKKAGKPSWACLIPLYSEYISYEAVWGNGWLFLIAEVLGLISNYFRTNSVVGVACFVGLLIVDVMHCGKIAKAFGKTAWYAVGLLIAQPIFMCILGFGDARYLGVPED